MVQTQEFSAALLNRGAFEFVKSVLEHQVQTKRDRSTWYSHHVNSKILHTAKYAAKYLSKMIRKRVQNISKSSMLHWCHMTSLHCMLKVPLW